MIVDHTDRLHESVDDGRPDEFEAAADEFLRHLARQRGFRRHLLGRTEVVELRFTADKIPQQRRKSRAALHDLEEGAGAVGSARAFLKIMESGPGFSALLWDFVGGKPKLNNFRAPKQVPAETALSRKMSKELIGRGFKFVGPTIVYAFMQAVGMVNDHLITGHRHADCAKISKRN